MQNDKLVEALEPCPFCGGEPKLEKQIHAHRPMKWIKCSICEASSTAYSTADSANAAWNRRAALRASTDAAPVADDYRQKLRMVISHASGGHLSDEADVERSINDICVQISQHHNRVWEAALEKGRKEVAHPPVSAAAVAGEGHPIDAATEAFNAFMDDAVSKAPEPLRKLGEYLSRLLDEDQWKTAEQYLNAAALSHPAPAEPVGLREDQRRRRETLIERIGTFADGLSAKPLPGVQGDVAYDLLRQAAAQISSDNLALSTLTRTDEASTDGEGRS